LEVDTDPITPFSKVLVFTAPIFTKLLVIE